MSEESTENSTYRLLLSIFFALVVVICLGGYRYYTTQRDAAEREVASELQSIADLKAEEITAWRAERLDDARVVTADPAFLSAIHAVVMDQGLIGGEAEGPSSNWPTSASRIAMLMPSY